MNKIQTVAFFFLITIVALPATLVKGQSLSSFNLSHQYNPSGPIQLQHRLVKTDQDYRIHFQLRLPAYDSLGSYTLSTFFRSAFADSSAFSETPHDWAAVTDVSTYPLLSGEIDIVPAEGQKIVVFHVKRPATQKSFFFDIVLEEENRFVPDKIVPLAVTGSPILRNYFSPRDSLHLALNDSATIYGFYYAQDFEEAKPPMVIDTLSVGKTIEIDSSFALNPGQLTIKKPGLYLFQTDSSSGSALALRMVPFYYPKFVSVDEVIATIRYISSREEYDRLASSKTRKKALDNFLLDISGSQDRAKRIMQNYFSRVADANSLFTGFKEGWKTDAGMVYIVFGPPNVVERNDVGEVWTYANMEDKTDLKFEFIRVKNIFTPGYLTLIRRDDYDRYWFRFVDLWRKGRI